MVGERPTSVSLRLRAATDLVTGVQSPCRFGGQRDAFDAVAGAGRRERDVRDIDSDTARGGALIAHSASISEIRGPSTITSVIGPGGVLAASGPNSTAWHHCRAAHTAMLKQTVAALVNRCRTQNGHIRNDTRDPSRRMKVGPNWLICRTNATRNGCTCPPLPPQNLLVRRRPPVRVRERA
jgi:hypothetical protein